MSLFDLGERVAIVTGGNGGIGLGIARGLSEAGARVVIAGRDSIKGAAAVASLGKAEALFVTADVTSQASCRQLVAEAVERFGRLDILVNNAGIAIRGAPENYTEAEWRAVLDTNLSSAFFCSQAAHPHMQAVGGGKIINIGSVMSVLAAPYSAPYAASKGGLLLLTKSLATAWASINIQVNCILPGWIDTELTTRAREQVAGLHDKVLARTPAGRWGAPSDLAGTAVFLASRASDFVTGAGIAVDGGYLSMA
ncbi:MAG: glucose 1-dehydrogenase [Alphaproteobacteria bacterium]|nr:glucose 1-dehydrogenase [Alphaproteobacteria bacterium]